MSDDTTIQVIDGIEIDEAAILKPGAHLEPSGVYLDLNHRDRGPFKALPGQEAGSGNRYVARRDLDQDVWNQLVESAPPSPTD